MGALLGVAMARLKTEGAVTHACRRCLGVFRGVQAPANGGGRSSPPRSDASAAWHGESCKGKVARVGARDGDFSRENKVVSRNTRHSRGLAIQVYVSGRTVMA